MSLLIDAVLGTSTVISSINRGLSTIHNVTVFYVNIFK